MLFLPAATKLGQGYIFTGVCDSNHRGVCLSACWDTTHPLPSGTRQAPQTRQAPGPGRHPGQTRQAPLPPGPGRHTPPRAEHTWRYGQQVGGMHPTGMQSCYHLQRSWGKVIFSQASVILFTGIPPQAGRQAGTHTPRPGRQAGPPGEEHTWRYGQRAGRMHPTGIQSCWKCFNF